MSLALWPGFLLAAFLIAVTPGPGAVIMVSMIVLPMRAVRFSRV